MQSAHGELRSLSPVTVAGRHGYVEAEGAH
jgi:hypothetical protein